MAEYKVVHERDKCISCGACVATDEKHWKMNDDMKADLIGAEKEGDNFVLEVGESEKAACMEAAETCPVNCIHILKGEEKLI